MVGAVGMPSCAARAAMEAAFDTYEALCAAGWKKERARGVLGTAVYTEFIWTVNAWSFINWLRKRLAAGAQYEHRCYARAAGELWRAAMPLTADAVLGDGLAAGD